MKIKNVICAALAAACVLAMAGCSGKPAETTAAPTTEAATEAAPGAYKPGTYTASAKGMESDVTVTVVVDETGMIAECTMDTAGETAGLGQPVGEKLPEAVLAAQSAEIDGVAGATITSGAALAALTDCLTQAAN